MLLLIGSFAAEASEAEVRALLQGVREIDAPGVPGPLCVFGDQAFPVVSGRSTGGAVEPVVAAARMGKGRVVAFGHNGYFGPKSLDIGDTARFLRNALDWSAGGALGNGQVGLFRNRDLAARLAADGVSAKEVSLEDLKDCKVLLLTHWALSREDLDKVRQFVLGGGGLVCGGLGWGWLQLNPGKELQTDFQGNLLLADAGIVWADGTLERTAPAGFASAEPPPALAHAGRALDAAMRQAEKPGALSRGDLNQASAVLSRAAQAVPPSDKLLLPSLRALAGRQGSDLIPSSSKPVRRENLLARILLTLQVRELHSAPAEQVRPHPAARVFPGEVPAGAPRVTREVSIDTRRHGWHSTGLYAAPGEVVAVETPEESVKAGLKLRIGAHSDRNWHHDAWKRVPEISRQQPLAATRTRAANAFGGLIYIEVPKNARPATYSVKLSGGVPAPHYVLGKTDLAAWRETIRKHPAPWAELESGKMILTVPSEVVRGLDHPDAVMETWDRILDLCAELATRTPDRDRPERIVNDEQISAGYMHAGYPIMTWMDQIQNVVDRKHLLEGNWGLFHEVGHNHQHPDWTFDGTGEVTVNLFTLYLYEKLCGIPPARHPRVSGDGLAKQLAKYSFDKPDFNLWKREPFLALGMYVQMQQAFGWEAFQKVFADYRALPEAQRPKNDDQKRDQWMVRFSRIVNRDLGPFFQAWGVPVSKEALASIKGLPAWMPPDFPPAARALAQ